MSRASYQRFTGSGAEHYQRYFVPAIATPVSVDLLRTADLQRGERVLDVACGTGVIARLAAERVGAEGAVIGIDIAPEMIDVAMTTTAAATPPIEWRVGDATAMPFDAATFDVVLCQMGLMFMEDQHGAAKEMHRVLAPAGRVVVNTPGIMHRLFELMDEGIAEHIDPELARFVNAVFSLHDPDVVAGLLWDADFVDVTVAVTSVTLRLPAPVDFLWQYINLTPMAPMVADASDAARSAMERQVVESWQPFVVDGGMSIEQQMVIASGNR